MMNKSLSEAHICVLRRFKSIRVYLHLHVIITFRRHKRLKWL